MISQSTTAILLLAIGGYYLHSETEEVRQMIARAPKTHYKHNPLTGKPCNFNPVVVDSHKGDHHLAYVADRVACVNEDEFVICGNPDKHGGFVWSAPQSCGGHCKGYLADDCTTDPYRAFNYHTVFCDVKPGPLPPAICGQVPAPTAQLAGNCDYNKQVAGCTHDGTSVQLCGFNAQGNGFTWYPAAACGTGTVCREFNVNGKTTAICDFPPPAK